MLNIHSFSAIELISEATMTARSVVGRSAEVIDMLTRIPKHDPVILSQRLPFEIVAVSRALSDLRDALIQLEIASLKMEGEHE